MSTVEPKVLHQQLQKWMRTRENVFFYDSCGVQNAFSLGKYQWIMGEGITDQLVLKVHETIDWNTVRGFLKQNPWCFITVSYDLKNKITGLSSENPDHLGWPLLTLVAPENVISLDHSGSIKVYARDEQELVNSILSAKQIDRPVPKTAYSREIASMSREDHHRKVEYIKEQIAEGNLYEMNLCMENILEEFSTNDAFGIYEDLVKTSPTPFSAYVKLGSQHLICASPERFITRKNDRIYSQPIKGTSRRYEDEQQDLISRLHLANSIKERAEHIMIVDLVRNDLSKICNTGTVRVDELFGIYGFKQVNQMISTVSGELQGNVDLVDCLLATFPMGSMTGAPKHITMQYIDQVETASRGWYSGSVGYQEPGGDFDLNVVIRSLAYDSDKHLAKYSVGGAITYDSDPEAEYEECLLKALAIRTVLDAGN